MGPKRSMATIKHCLFFMFLAFYSFTGSLNAKQVSITVVGTGLNTYFQSLSGTIADTVEIVGTASDTFLMSTSPNNLSSGSILFRGSKASPDSFPVIKHTGGDFYNLFNKVGTQFERLTFTGTGATSLVNGNVATDKKFSKCIITGFNTSYFFDFQGGDAEHRITFVNCLFYNNTNPNGIIKIKYYTNGKPRLAVANCTFDKNTRIFNDDEGITDQSLISIKNCIFSGASTYFSTNSSLKTKITNSLTSEASGYGSNCVYSSTPDYISSSPEKASDFRLAQTSKAKAIGDTVAVSATDISGMERGLTSGKMDAGCWTAAVGGPAEITADPKDTTVVAGTSAKFVVTAKGTAPIHYYWYRNGVAVSGFDTSVYSFTAKAEDNGAKYFCRVVNQNGLGFDTSLQATLTVRSKPVVTLNTYDTILTVDDSLTLVANATGGDVKYQWLKNNTKLNNDTLPSLKLMHLTKSDSGSYRCIATNIAGTDTSKIAIVHILGAEPNIYVQLRDTVVSVGDTVTLTIAATGKNLHYAWYKTGLQQILATTQKFVKQGVTISDSGNYYCVVSNDSGSKQSNTAHLMVIPQGISNPLQLSAGFISKDSVSLTIKNFKVIPFTAGTKPYADTVGIWYQEDSSPSNPDKNAANLIKIPLSRMQNSGNSYTQRVKVKPGSKDCYTYYFKGSVFWHNPDSIPPFNSSSADAYMCDSSILANPIGIECTWHKNDSITLMLNGLSKLKPDSISYVHFWLVNGNADIVHDTLRPSQIKQGVDVFSKSYVNSLFSGELINITWKVLVKGILGNASDTVRKTITVGTIRTENHAKLLVKKTSANKIEIKWSIPSTDLIDSIRIWYGTDSIGVDPQAAPVGTKTVTKASSEDSLTISNLEKETRYYIALQVHKKECLWSFFTDSSRASAKTIDKSEIPNTIRITGIGFDSLTNLVNISWNIDTSGLSHLNMDVAVAWRLGTYPEVDQATVFLPISSKSTAIDMDDDLMFNSTYYFAMGFRINGENTTWVLADSASRDTVNISSPLFQKITFFEKEKIIAYALGRKVTLKTEKGYDDDLYTDTIMVFNPTKQQIPDGLYPVSLGIDFLRAFSTDPLSISIQFDTSLIPLGFSSSDVRLYEYDSTTGGWNFLTGTIIDKSSRTVQKVVKSLSTTSKPLMLMVDTREPVVSISADSDTASVISTNVSVTTKLSLNDNIDKLKVTVTSCNIKGEPLVISDVLTSLRSYTVSIPDSLIYKDFGLKAVITVSDGRYTKNIDISRSVKDSINRNSEALKWIPVYSNLVLDKPDVPNVFKNFCDGQWKYDSTEFRIFTWSDSVGKPGSNGWVEYLDKAEIREKFTLIPGRVLWLKTRELKALNLGAGHTVSLKEPYTLLTIKSQNWNDISLPYKFDIFIDDILACSAGADSSLLRALRESLLFYSWEESNSVSTNLRTVSVHNPLIPDESKADTSLSYENSYSVFNMLDKDITLRVPAIPRLASQFSLPKALNKKKSGVQWGISLKAHTDDEDINSVYFGYSQGLSKTTVPQSPSFSGVTITLLNEENGTRNGIVITNEENDHGYVIPIIIENRNGSTAKIGYNVEKIAAVPENFSAIIADPQTGIVESDMTIDMNPKETAYRLLIVGDATFIDSKISQMTPANFVLVKMYPNPFRKSIQIQFTLPYTGIRRVEAVIFDQLGRTVWNSIIEKGLQPGKVNSLYWNPHHGKIASGAYIVRLTAINENGSVHGRTQQRIMYFP